MAVRVMQRGKSAAAAALRPTLTAEYLLKTDAALRPLATPTVAVQYAQLASDDTLAITRASLLNKLHTVTVAATPADALAALKAHIPAGATVHSTSSISLAEIGYTAWAMEGGVPFRNLNSEFLAEKDPKRQAELRRAAALADVVLTSPVAVTVDGEVLIADATGTRIAPILSGRSVVFVVGGNKIMPTLADAERRLRAYVYPLESARMRAFYNNPNASSSMANVLTLRTGNLYAQKRVHFILVKAALGY
jgi:hypothetical protein